MRNQAALALASAGMIAVLGGCETVAEEANEAVGFEYVAMLAPSGGGAAAGKAEISLNDATNTLCTDLELSGVTMTVGHVVGPDGTAIATLDVPKGAMTATIATPSPTPSSTPSRPIRAPSRSMSEPPPATFTEPWSRKAEALRER